MATLTIRNFEEPLKLRLRQVAASHNRSMEEEVRQILRTALQDAPPTAAPDLGSQIRARVAAFGGIDLKIAEREPARSPPDFADWGKVPPRATKAVSPKRKA